jgi:hypothetical protein
MRNGFSFGFLQFGVLCSLHGITDLLKLDPQITFITVIVEEEHLFALLRKCPVNLYFHHAFEIRSDFSLPCLRVIPEELVALGRLVKIFDIVIEAKTVVETQMKRTADLPGELEERNPFRYGEDTVRVAPYLPFVVALDDPEDEDPFAGLCLAPVHRDLMIGVCCSPHDENVIRDTISGCLLFFAGEFPGR